MSHTVVMNEFALRLTKMSQALEFLCQPGGSTETELENKLDVSKKTVAQIIYTLKKYKCEINSKLIANGDTAYN